jgi:hypothetical protein
MPECIDTGTYAAIGATTTLGKLYLPNNGVEMYRANGALWAPFGPSLAFVEPVSGDFSWINQGAATLDTTHGGIQLYSPVSGGTWDLHMRVKSAPSTPYSISAAFLMNGAYGVGPLAGLVWRQSSDGKLVGFFRYMNAATYEVTKFTDETTLSANYVSLLMSERDTLHFLRIADDGASRTCAYSLDGRHWTQVHTVGRTDFLTADQVGFVVGVNVATAGFCMTATLLSWEES